MSDNQEKEMRDVLELSNKVLCDLREKCRPQARWNWWNSGKLMNKEELEDFDAMCNNFERDIASANNVLEKKGAYNFETVEKLQRLASLMYHYSTTYTNRRR
jgi:hypothetical protein